MERAGSISKTDTIEQPAVMKELDSSEMESRMLQAACNISVPCFFKIFLDGERNGIITPSTLPNADLLSILVKCRADNRAKVQMLDRLVTRRPDLCVGILNDDKWVDILETGQSIGPGVEDAALREALF